MPFDKGVEMMFKIWFLTSNSAFDTPQNRATESARILKDIADTLAIDHSRTTGRIRDVNGNGIGVWDMHAPA